MSPIDTAGFRIEALGPQHERANFSCGVEPLDIYFRQQAGQDLKKHAAVPFIITPDGKRVAGYYTLSQYAVELGVIPEAIKKKLPRYPMVSVTLLGRLAVSREFHGQGLGQKLLMDALYRSLQLSNQVASAGVIVDAKDRSAVEFYKKYGFLELPLVERRLFLEMATIEAMF